MPAGATSRWRWAACRSTGQTSVQAELVAFRVAHDMCQRPPVAMRLDQPRTEPYQACNLGRLLVGIDVDVKMHPVLGDLALRYALEKDPGLDTRRISTCRHVPERGALVDHDPVIRGHATVDDQLVDQRRVVFHRSAEHLLPDRAVNHDHTSETLPNPRLANPAPVCHLLSAVVVQWLDAQVSSHRGSLITKWRRRVRCLFAASRAEPSTAEFEPLKPRAHHQINRNRADSGSELGLFSQRFSLSRATSCSQLCRICAR